MGNILPYNVFSCKCISSVVMGRPLLLSSQTVGSSNNKLHRCIGHMMWRVLGNILCDFEGQGQIKYFLVNASPPKQLEVAASNFAGASVT